MSKPSQLQPGPRSSASKGTRSPTFPFPDLRPDSPVPKSSTDESRRPGPSRVASYLSLAKRANSSPEPPLSSPRMMSPVVSNSNNSTLFVREQDKVWHSPNVDQMVEALQVGLMERGSLEPVPVHHNAYVLSLIEAFAKGKRTIAHLDSELAKAHREHERTREHFKTVAGQWLERDQQYKAEVKRLEVLLSRASQEGVAAVTLARADSIVDRNGPQAKKFTSELKRLSDHKPEEKSPSRPRNRELSDTEPPSIFSSRFTETLREITTSKRGEQQTSSEDTAPKPPLPLILDRDFDYIMGQRVERAEAADRANRAAAKAAARAAARAERKARKYSEAGAEMEEEAEEAAEEAAEEEVETKSKRDRNPFTRFSFEHERDWLSSPKGSAKESS